MSELRQVKVIWKGELLSPEGPDLQTHPASPYLHFGNCTVILNYTLIAHSRSHVFTMVSEKRKASSDIPRAPRQQAHLDTIETLEPLECKYNATTLTKDNFEKAFPSIPLAQQHVDLWTIFQAPCFKHGSTKAGLFDSWLRIHAFTLEQVVQWRQGPLSNTLPQWKPSEAKITTRVVKKMRMLSIEVAAVSDREELETKCLKMELDYSMLMYATQLHNVDNMIPDHNQRIEHLVQRLSPKAANPLALEEGQRSNVLEMDNQEQEENIIRDIAVSFLQQPDPNLPTMIGHDGNITYIVLVVDITVTLR